MPGPVLYTGNHRLDLYRHLRVVCPASPRMIETAPDALVATTSPQSPHRPPGSWPLKKPAIRTQLHRIPHPAGGSDSCGISDNNLMSGNPRVEIISPVDCPFSVLAIGSAHSPVEPCPYPSTHIDSSVFHAHGAALTSSQPFISRTCTLRIPIPI